MALSTDKRYYKIGDVAEMLGLTQSTLRFWEQHFAMARPERNSAGTRRYTPKTIENLRILKFLLHDKGLRIEAAKEELKANRDGIIRRAEALARLSVVRDRLQELLDSLHKLR
ncbi:MAG: MerR family transcriptional regulator [Duncaniella sp.]|nr:MerR family transcriptional regulator [Duncaniella sp.]MDE6177873.1 MerR family transcriptional regulator [Duncaniella sp.]